MSKSPEAFRTIREVADWLGVAAHVLRFWESRFPQIKPVKRAGGRRYYRPADMALIGGIKVLLHDEGMTIRGVQKMIKTQGVAALAARAPDLGIGAFDTSPVMAAVEDAPAAQAPIPSAPANSRPKPVLRDIGDIWAVLPAICALPQDRLADLRIRLSHAEQALRAPVAPSSAA